MEELEFENSPSKEIDEETLFIVTQTFKALGDPTRVRILHLLFQKNVPLMKLQIRWISGNRPYLINCDF